MSSQSDDDARTKQGLAETVQRLSSEDETPTAGAVRIETMANEVARLNKPTAFSGAEDECSDWDFALTCFVGTMDGPLLKELQAVPEQNGYEAYQSLVLRYGSRGAHRETKLLLKMNINFGEIDVMESKFEELNLLIKEHDDIYGRDIVPDTIKRVILVTRASEPLRNHLQLNSQWYSTSTRCARQSTST